MWRTSIGLVLVGIALAAGASAADEVPPPRVIEYAADALTIRVTKVAVTEVLDELGRQAGADIRGSVVNPREVSTEFERVPLPDALHRLLGAQNFTLVYGEGGRLRAVKLLGGPQAAPVALPAPVVASAPATSPDAAQNLMSIVASHPPVAVTGRLAGAFKAEQVSVQQLLEASVRNEDAAVRSDAIRRALSVLEAEPDFRSATLNTLKGMDDADLANLLRTVSGEHAQEFVVHVATLAHGSEFRIKASGVLQQLRAQAKGS